LSTEYEKTYLHLLEKQIDQVEDYLPRQLRGHRVSRMAVIACGGAVPVLASWSVCPRPVLALFGAAAAAIEAFAQLMQFQSKAGNAMRASNELRQEMNLFLFQAGPYAIDHSFPRFVERIEEIRAQTSGSFLTSLQSGTGQPPQKSDPLPAVGG
jgi:hypothetical protein